MTSPNNQSIKDLFLLNYGTRYDESNVPMLLPVSQFLSFNSYKKLLQNQTIWEEFIIRTN
jgi:hypothetical protein